MRAVQFHTYGGVEVLQIDDVAIPDPGPGQVLIQVEASAVHPGDVVARSGGFAAVIEARAAYRPGWDFAGRVQATGPGVDDLAVGTAVVGMTDWLRDLNGTHAEFVVLDRSAVVAAPRSLGADAAAALPVDALTASQALDLLGLTSGDTLVVLGAAGAVGGFALELAVGRGLRVLGVAGRADEPVITARGGVFVDRDDDLGRAVQALAPGGADALFDTASVATPALAAIRDGGSYCGVIHPFAPLPERGIAVSTVGVHSNPDTLAGLVHLVDTGELTLRVAAHYPLADAAQAHTHLAKGGTRGAVVLLP